MKEHIGRREYSVEVKKYGPKQITAKKHNTLENTPEATKELLLQPNKEIIETLPDKDSSAAESTCIPTPNITQYAIPVGGKMVPEIFF